jgi:hypothetical protein
MSILASSLALTLAAAPAVAVGAPPRVEASC